MVQGLSAYMPNIATPSQMMRNACIIAPIAVALHAITNTQTASAGAIVYAICVAGCCALQPGNAVWAATCTVLCAPGGLSPTP